MPPRAALRYQWHKIREMSRFAHECMYISPVIDLYTLLCMDLQKKLKLWGLISLSASCMHYSFASKFFIEIVETFSGIQLLLKQISMLKYSFVTRVLVSSSLSLSALPPFLSPSLYDRVAVIIGTRKLIRWCFCDSPSLRSS